MPWFVEYAAAIMLLDQADAAVQGLPSGPLPPAVQDALDRVINLSSELDAALADLKNYAVEMT
jgi:hypothetical protein